MEDYRGKYVIFEADDLNDPDWEEIIKCLEENGFKVLYGDGNWMNIFKYNK